MRVTGLLMTALIALWGCGEGGTLQAGGPVDDTDNGTGPDAAPPADAAGPSVVDLRVPGANAQFLFDEGTGTTIADSGGATNPLDLTIPDPLAAQWVPGGGLTVSAPTILAAANPAASALGECRINNEVTVEAWIQPANIEQTGPARIVTFSLDINARNVTLGQATDTYEIRLRTSETDLNGLPATISPAGSATTNVQHVVYTRSAADETARVYIDGVLATELLVAGTFVGWDYAHTFALANEIGGERPWLGTYHLAAVYCRALTEAEIQQNYNAGY